MTEIFNKHALEKTVVCLNKTGVCYVWSFVGDVVLGKLSGTNEPIDSFKSQCHVMSTGLTGSYLKHIRKKNCDINVVFES